MAEPVPILSLDEQQSLRERIVQRLRDAIVAGDLPANSRLAEPELAKRLGVSRTPLREAIRQLAAEGFVSTTPRVGSFVSHVTPQDAEELYAVRAVIEGLAARQAAENPDPVKREILGEILDELTKRKGDLRRYHEMSGQFHDAIVSLSGNRRLQAIHKGVSLHVSRMRALSLAGRGRPEVSLGDHRRIVAAIVRGRGAEAERLMRAHVEGARRVVKRRIAREERRTIRE